MSTEFLDKTGLSYFWSRLKAWCNSLFVHLTGNETITGRKVFVDSDTQLKSSEIERTVDISGNSKYLGLSLHDKNGDLLGFFQYMRRDSGAADVKIGCFNPANTDVTDNRSIYVGYDDNGIPFANAPSTSTLRLNGSDIVTRDFIPNDSRIFHTSGNETATGTKTFNATTLYLKSPVIDKSVTPTDSNQGLRLFLTDKNGHSLGILEYVTRTNGVMDIKLGCYKHSSDTDFNGLYVINTANDGSCIQFNDSAHVIASNIQRTVSATGSDKFTDLVFYGFDLNVLGACQYARRTNGQADIKLSCYNPATTTITENDLVSLRVGYDENGIQFASAPSTSSSRNNGLDIVTRNWIPNDSRIVHSTGNENIAGIKTFTDSGVEIQSTVIQRAVSPSSGVQAMSLRFKDKDDKHIGFIQYITRDTGAVDIKMSCYKPTVADDFAAIYLGYDANGIAYATAPSTSASRNSGSDIVTMDWIPNDSRIVHITGTEEISGRKAFMQDMLCVNSSWTKGSSSASNVWRSVIFSSDGSSNYNFGSHAIGYMQVGIFSDGNTGLQLSVMKNTANSTSNLILQFMYVKADDTGIFRPTTNNAVILGSSGYRWKEMWCTQSSINSSSDERRKDGIVPVPDDVLDAWEDVDFRQFKFRDAMEEKGAGARIHSGLIAQHVERAFRKHGLDASRYGFFLHDEWDAEPEECDESGTVVRKAVSAGDAYGLRYVECLCIEAAYMRRENARLRKRVADLEERLAALELKIA